MLSYIFNQLGANILSVIYWKFALNRNDKTRLKYTPIITKKR